MISGLTKEQVTQRKQEGKVNGKMNYLTRSKKEIIYSNIFTYFNFVNLVLFIFVLITGQIKNGLFMGTILFNACIGIYQEIKSKKLLDQLTIVNETKVIAIRDGNQVETLSEDIVEGDILIVSSGLQLPVDAKVLEGNLSVDESMLTGESNYIHKEVNDTVSSGTIIISGKATIEVIHLFRDSIASSIMDSAKKEKKAESILQKDLQQMIRIISFIIIPAGILLYFVQSQMIGLTWKDALLKTIAALVGMIPEGLIVLTSIALAVSTIRLSKKNVLVQDLFSIEALARVDTVCFDKTGTLTTGNMKVKDIIPVSITKEELISYMNSYLYENEDNNATSKALLHYFSPINQYKKINVLPFDSRHKYAAATLESVGTLYVGGYSILFQDINHDIEEYTKEGYRVISIGLSQLPFNSSIPDDLKLIGYIVIEDELRDNAKEIFKYFKKQNITIKIISGDDPRTVSSIARLAGLKNYDQYIDLSKEHDDFEKIVDEYTIFSRVKPEEKKQLVQALQNKGHHVLMSGDGVNDIPSLKVADVSVSIKDASDAAKNNANIVLLNNDFGEIPSVVDEGRRVINNISRASSMYLVKTTFSILLSIYVIITQQSYPFLPIHLTFISAIGVGIPTFILQMEPSFERIQGNFLKNAFLKALPSGLSVFITAMVCILLRNLFQLTESQFSGIFVFLTAYIYLLTLYKIYFPLTKLRLSIILLMGLSLVLLFIIGKPLLSVEYQVDDAWILLIGMIIDPIVVYVLTILFSKVKYGSK